MRPKTYTGTIAYALVKVGAIKCIEHITLGKFHEYQADSCSIEFSQNSEQLRNAAHFLRTTYYQKNYLIPTQECKQQWDVAIEKTPVLPKVIKKLLRNSITPACILKWKFLINQHPSPLKRAERLEYAAHLLEQHKTMCIF